MLTVKLTSFALGILIGTIMLFRISSCDDYKVIETNDGAVRGCKSATWFKNVDYYSFKGIPYAEKPTGTLRFKAPQPKKPWTPNTLDAFKFGQMCLQSNTFLPILGPLSEDCLFLNIYVPADVKPDEKIPVLFFIHGGAYQEGNGDMYGPNFIVEKRVILVTINYRIGIFGFLSLNTTEYSGNMGLKDQLLALKWIYKNIENFNGDNNQITIMGQSSGGASVNLHILSTESRKYFQNAILISGTAFNYWAMSDTNNDLDLAYQLAKNLGKPTTQLNELIEILQSESPEKLSEYSSSMANVGRTLTFLVAPVIERSDAIQPFITESIEKIYENGGIDINTMFTATSNEMLFFTAKDVPETLDIEGLNSNFTLKLPFRNLNIGPQSEELRAVNDEIRQFYFGNDAIDMSKVVEYVDLLNDLNFLYPIDKTVKLHASKSTGKTFYTRFSVDSTLNTLKKIRSEFNLPGAAHAEDLIYFFSFIKLFYQFVQYTPFLQQSKICTSTIEHMTNLMTDFAKIKVSGCSSCMDLGFEPIRNDEINFLNITNDGLIVGLDPNAKAIEFWTNINKKIEKYIGAGQN